MSSSTTSGRPRDRNDLAEGVREFILVDAVKGKRGRAFDHNRLAAAFRGKGAMVTWVKMTAGRDGKSLWPLYHDYFFTNEAAARHRDIREVAQRDWDLVAAGLLAQSGDHGR